MGVFISTTGLQILTWIFASVAIILTTGRYILRYRKTGRLYWDDAAHGLALATMIAVCGIFSNSFWYEHVIDDYALGLGPPPPTDSYIRFLKIQLSVSILFWICIYAVKLSFLLLYRMLFVVSTWSNRAWWGVLVFTMLTFWLVIAGELTACGPSKNLFHEKPCQSASNLPLFHAILIYSCVANVLSDLTIMAFPLLKLRTLQIRRSQKFILATIFCLALLVIAIDLTRTVVSIHGGAIGAQSALWGVLEPTIAVIVGCLPAYRTLFRRRKTSRTSSRDRFRPLLEPGSGGKSKLSQTIQRSSVAPFDQSLSSVSPSQVDTIVESCCNSGNPKRLVEQGAARDTETGLELPGIAVTKGWEVH